VLLGEEIRFPEIDVSHGAAICHLHPENDLRGVESVRDGAHVEHPKKSISSLFLCAVLAAVICSGVYTVGGTELFDFLLFLLAPFSGFGAGLGWMLWLTSSFRKRITSEQVDLRRIWIAQEECLLCIGASATQQFLWSNFKAEEKVGQLILTGVDQTRYVFPEGVFNAASWIAFKAVVLRKCGAPQSRSPNLPANSPAVSFIPNDWVIPTASGMCLLRCNGMYDAEDLRRYLKAFDTMRDRVPKWIVAIAMLFPGALAGTVLKLDWANLSEGWRAFFIGVASQPLLLLLAFMTIHFRKRRDLQALFKGVDRASATDILIYENLFELRSAYARNLMPWEGMTKCMVSTDLAAVTSSRSSTFFVFAKRKFTESDWKVVQNRIEALPNLVD
jgi:hypothetical protein